MKHAATIFIGTLALALSASGLAASDPVVTVVMTRLDNPRGLAFGPGGALFVAEAGRGGAPCPPTGTGGLTCYGLTGAVSRLWHGQQDRIVSGLPSLSFPQGAQGPDGALYVTNHGAAPAFKDGVYTPIGEVLRIDLGDDGHECHEGHDHDDGDDGHHDHEGR